MASAKEETTATVAAADLYTAAATEQLEAILKGGPTPYILRPQALNLVVSKVPTVPLQSCAQLPSSGVSIKAVLMVGQHLYAYYSGGAGSCTEFHIGRLDTLTGTWESSTKTMVTPPPGSMVVPFNFSSSTDVKSKDLQAQESQQQRVVRKPSSHPHQLKGFLVLTPDQGVIVHTLGDLYCPEHQQRTIGHYALLQTIEQQEVEEEGPEFLFIEDDDAEPGGDRDDQQHQQQEQQERRDNQELLQNNFPELNRLMAFFNLQNEEVAQEFLHRRGNDLHRLVVEQLHAQVAMHAKFSIKWLAAAVDAPSCAIYAQAEVVEERRLLNNNVQTKTFFRLDLSGTPEATEQPWRRLDVPNAEAIPAAAVMAVHDGHLYLLARVVEQAAAAAAVAINGNAPRRFDVHHVYRINLTTLAWQRETIHPDRSTPPTTTTFRPLVNLVDLAFAQRGPLLYCLGTEEIPLKEPNDQTAANQLPKYRNELWTLNLATCRLRSLPLNDHLVGKAVLQKPLLAVTDQHAAVDELWALETKVVVAPPLANLASLSVPSVGIVPEGSLPLYRVPLADVPPKLRELARDAFLHRPPRGLQVMAEAVEAMEEEEALANRKKMEMVGVVPQGALKAAAAAAEVSASSQQQASTSAGKSTTLKRKSVHLINAANKRRKTTVEKQQDDYKDKNDKMPPPPSEMAPVLAASQSVVKRFLHEIAAYPAAVFRFPPEEQFDDGSAADCSAAAGNNRRFRQFWFQ